MKSLGDAVLRIGKAATEASAPAEFKALANAVRSPVDLVSAIVRWAMTLSPEAVAALDAEISRCCRLSAEAVKAYRLYGLESEAAALLALLPSPAVKSDAVERAAPARETSATARPQAPRVEDARSAPEVSING